MSDNVSARGMMLPLTNHDLVDLVAFRRALHRVPEISRHEQGTAAMVVARLATLRPDRILTGLGGHGVAAIFDSGTAGPTVMLRAELDALPIPDEADVPHHSTVPGKGHLCGHDGHMATVLAAGTVLSRQRPRRGRVVLMFQPAEEDGSGAAAVIADPHFCEIAPDLAFALHNMPGLPLGHVALDTGPANCASRGLRIRLTGRTSHASMPEDGLSPMSAMSELMPALAALSKGVVSDNDFALVTITHARLGEAAFGIAPGIGEIWATLRTLCDCGMAALVDQAECLAQAAAQRHGLGITLDYDDVFLACENDPDCVAHLRQAMDDEGIAHSAGHPPMRGSEDFGRFGQTARSAMFFLGAGERHPALHTATYDYPDDLISIGARVFLRVIRTILG